MADVPEPLTPPDCDLRGLAFMPLDVIRLLDSDIFAISTGEEFKAALALWCKAWQQVPAASLPNDDRILAHLSGAGSRWKKVKAVALRGWIECTDGRLYHPTVAEKAIEALPMRQEYRERQSGAAERKAREREDRKVLFALLRSHGITPEWDTPTRQLRSLAEPLQSQPDTEKVTEHVTEPVTPVTNNVTAKTGTGTGTGTGTNKKKVPLADANGAELDLDAPPESAPPDPAKIMFDSGVALLGEGGVSAAKARSLLGKWKRDHGEGLVIEALGRAKREGAIEPVSFIEGCLRQGRHHRGGSGLEPEGMPC